MFKIGDFSKLSQVSVKTLHHYDEIGLLKPAEVDALTGYRRYALDQLARLNRILALKDLGFSLEQIARLLDGGLPYEAMREILLMKQAEIERRVAEEQGRLARVAARLRLIQQEGAMTVHDVRVRPIEPLTVASVREMMPNVPYMQRRMHEFCGALTASGVAFAGPLMTLFHQVDFREQDLDVEIAAPVAPGTALDAALEGGLRLGVRELPAVERVATLVYAGEYDTLSEPYGAIARWLAEHGEEPALPVREIYLANDEGKPPVTEIQYPLGAAS